MSIAFTCTGCGRLFRVADALAGQKGTCPVCRATFNIPTNTCVAFSAAAKVGLSKDNLIQSPDSAGPVPTTFFSRQSVLAAGFAAALIVAGITLHRLDRAMISSSPSTTFQDDLRFLPNQTQCVNFINVEKILATPGYRKIKLIAEKSAFDFEQQFMERVTHLKISDIQRVTIGITAQVGFPYVAVVTTLRPIQADDVKQVVLQRVIAPSSHSKTRMNARIAPADFSYTSVGPYGVHELDGTAFSIVDEHTVVFAKPSIIRQILSRNGAPELHASVKKSLQSVNPADATLSIAMNLGFLKDGPQARSIPVPDLLRRLKGVEAYSLQVDMNGSFRVKATAICDDARHAEEIRKAADIDFSMAAGNLPRPILWDADLWAKLLRSAEASCHGTNVTVHFSADAATIVGLGKEFTEQFNREMSLSLAMLAFDPKLRLGEPIVPRLSRPIELRHRWSEVADG